MRRKSKLGFGLIGASVLLAVAMVTVALGATAQGTDVEVSEDALSEVTIDVNPTNGNNLVVVGHEPGGFENMNTYFTTDGGGTWSAVDLGDAGDGIASNFRFDPAVVFDANGTAYAAYGATETAGALPNTRVVVARSTDGGATYPTFRELANNPRVPNVPGNDRWTFATGPDGADDVGQRTYLAWTRNVDEDAGAGVSLDQQIVVSSTGDGGNTWSAPVVVNDGSNAGSDAGNLTALPAVGPDGDLYLVWHDIGGNRIMFDRSTDGGVTWGTDSVVTASGVGFLVSIPPQNDRGISPLGALAADRSGGTNDDRIYLAYLDTAGMPDTNVFVRFSDNDGGTWSAPTRINDDAGTTSQFLPWLTVDQATGLVAAVWYDARDDATNRAVHVYSGVSHNGGTTWDANVRVTDNPSDMSANNPGSYTGDFLEYIGVAALDCQLVPVWSDNSETADTNPATADDNDYFVDRLIVTGGLCNTPPTVDAGGPYTTSEGTNVTVSATGSDVNGDTITYAWDLDNNGTFETPGQSVTFDNVGQDGTFTIAVRADDGRPGGTATDTATVTVTNVAPTVTIANNGPKSENTAVTVSGVVSDAGFLETPLTASIDWGDGTGPQPLSGTVESDRPFKTITYSALHTYGDDGTFTVTVCAADDDTTGNCNTTSVTITNTNPTAVIDESGTVLVNGIPTFVAHAGVTVPFEADSFDPGSDDRTTTWDWGDGAPSPDSTELSLNNVLFNPDPDPSPTINPRTVTDDEPHAFGEACFYTVTFGSADDDGGSASDTVKVIVAGNASLQRNAGYWQTQYRPRPTSFTEARRQCYLAIAGFMSSVFNEVRNAGTVPAAFEVLKVSQKAETAKEQLDRQILTAWLNFANGAFDLTELVDTDGNGSADTQFATVMATAEATRLNPASTDAQLRAQRDILQRINGN
jgi:hypothetical protein